VSTDAKHLYQRQLIEGQSVGFMEQVRWNPHQNAHTAIHVNAEDPKVLTAVWPSLEAGAAFFTGDIWFDRTPLTWFEVPVSFRHGDHFTTDLVP
jgi:hypothetical protein